MIRFLIILGHASLAAGIGIWWMGAVFVEKPSLEDQALANFEAKYTLTPDITIQSFPDPKLVTVFTWENGNKAVLVGDQWLDFPHPEATGCQSDCLKCHEAEP